MKKSSIRYDPPVSFGDAESSVYPHGVGVERVGFGQRLVRPAVHVQVGHVGVVVVEVAEAERGVAHDAREARLVVQHVLDRAQLLHGVHLSTSEMRSVLPGLHLSTSEMRSVLPGLHLSMSEMRSVLPGLH